MTALELDRARLTDTRHQAYFSSPMLQSIVDRVVWLCERIPKDINLAFHPCYGDLQHKHFIEPRTRRSSSSSPLVELANALLAGELTGFISQYQKIEKILVISHLWPVSSSIALARNCLIYISVYCTPTTTLGCRGVSRLHRLVPHSHPTWRQNAA